MVAHVVRQIRRRGGNVQMQREFGNAQCEKGKLIPSVAISISYFPCFSKAFHCKTTKSKSDSIKLRYVGESLAYLVPGR